MNIPKSLNLLNIIHFLLGAILFLVPVFFLPYFSSPFIEPKTFLFLGLVEVTFLFYVVLALFNKDYRPKKNFITCSFGLFLLISIFSAFAGVDALASFWSNASRFDGVIVLAHLFLFFLVLSSVIRKKDEAEKLIWASIVSAVLVSLSVFAVYFDLFKTIYLKTGFNVGASGGFIGNDSYTGAYLMFAVFFALYLIWNTKQNIKRYVLEIFLAIILISPVFFNFSIFSSKVSLLDISQNPMLLLGNARAPAIAIFGSIILMTLLALLKSSSKRLKVLAKFGLGFIILISIVVSVSVFVPGTKVNDWFLEKTGGNRFIFWHQALEGIKDRPLLGWGPGNFSYVNDKYFDPRFVRDDFQATDNTSDKAHNIILDTAVTTGILGLVSYLVLFYGALFLLWKSKEFSYTDKTIITGLYVAYFIQNLVFFDVLVSYLPFVFLLGLVSAFENKEEDFYQNTEVKVLDSKQKMIIGFSVLFTFMALRFFVWLPAKESYLNFKFYSLSPEERLVYEGDRELSKFGTSRNIEAHSFALINWYYQNLNTLKQNPNKSIYLNDLDIAIKDIIDSSKDSGITFWGADSIFKLNDIKYKLTSDESFFADMYNYSELEMELVPKSVRGYINNAQVLFYQKKYLESIKVLEQAILFSPNNPVLHALVIDIARVYGKKDLIEAKIKNAEANVPNFNFR